MDLKNKIIAALSRELRPEYVRVEDDDGISGFVVSREFDGMSAMDRQERIDQALRKAALSRENRSKVLMIAGLTPPEYDAVGTPIRVHRVEQMAGGAVEICLHGGTSDAEYVQRLLQHQKGIKTTQPKPVNGAGEFVMSFRARGSSVTKEKAIGILRKDPYIHVMPDA